MVRYEQFCPECGRRMKPLFTSFYCPNNCDRRPHCDDDGWTESDDDDDGWIMTSPGRYEKTITMDSGPVTIRRVRF